MANWQVISLDTTTPQLRAPGTGDGYSFNSGSTQLGVWTTTGLGIGTASPVAKLAVQDSTAPKIALQVGAAEKAFLNYTQSTFVTRLDSDGPLSFASNNTEAVYLTSSQDVGVGTQTPDDKLSVAGNIGAAQTGNAGFKFYSAAPGSNALEWFLYNSTSNSNALQLSYYNSGVFGGTVLTADKSGNIGIGVTPSAWGAGSQAMQNGGGAVFQYNNDRIFLGQNNYIDSSFADKFIGNGYATRYRQYQGTHAFFVSTASNSSGAGASASFTQAMTLDGSGQLALGTSTASSTIGRNLTINGANAGTNSGIVLQSATTERGYVYASDTQMVLGSSASIPLLMLTSGTVRASITSGGDFLVGTTSAVQYNTSTVTGWNVNNAGQMAMAASATATAYFNRLTDDGTIISLRQDGVEEGTISVSGNTVSYNAFAGSHWSQLQDGSKPDILRGTVMESINELCVWPGENNERLPKAKISDTAGSKKVYGVFMAWDNDWTETNDMYVTAVGAFICRVNGSVTVEEGDLLESNGDGTARVQADDIIRSSTIGKVTSTVKTHEYDDGSYCVPTVLYCG